MHISELYKIFLQSTGICTDTRNIEKGNLFFALKGPNFNANKLAKEAIKKGAIAAIIDEGEFDEGENFILVNDGLTTLQELANHHRKQFNIPIIGITGSNGKTTTKELIATVLETTYKTHYTKGNLNNHIGVPLSLLAMPLDSEIAIIEMGANHIGEIADLCKIAEPNFGLITNIGKAHLEGFGSFEGVARGKSELYLHLHKNNGIVFINSSDDHLMRMANRLENKILFPQKGDFFECEYIGSNPFIEYKQNNEIVKTQLIGKYNFYNLATALCIGKYFKISDEICNKSITKYNSDNNRSQVIRKGTNTIILDAYNANPSSMKAAIINFHEMQADNKIAILGDMLELGVDSKKEHELIGEILSECNIKSSVVVGPEMLNAHKKFPTCIWFKTKEELNNWMQNQKIENSTLLIKGSRGMSLESVI